MQRPSFSLGFLAILAVILFCPGFFLAGASSQSARPMKDPILDPIFTAEREGRLLEAEKLVTAAIQKAQAQSSPDPRLHLLLSHLGSIDSRLGRTAEAIAAAKQMLALDEKVYGAESGKLIVDLNNLGTFYQMAGDEAAAGQAFERELAVARKTRSNLLMAIGDLSHHYERAHRTAEATALLTEAVQICDGQPGPHFPHCSDFRSRLADIYRKQGHPNAAEEIVTRGDDQTMSANRDWFTQVGDLNALARQYEQDHSYDLAEATYRQAIAIIQKTFYLKDPAANSAGELLFLGRLFEKEGRSADAEDVYKSALDATESASGPERPNRAESLLAFIVPLEALYRTDGRLSDLEPILQQALGFQERVLGPDHIKLADTLVELAAVYQDEEKYWDAEPLYRRAIEIQEKNNGPDDPHLIGTLDRYASLLRQLHEPDKAQAVAARAAALQQKLAPQTPKIPAHSQGRKANK